MLPDGSGATRLTNAPGEDRRPAWSPDGRKIAFVSARDGNDEIYVMNADGSGQTRLTVNDIADGSPAWSSDASKIALSRENPGHVGPGPSSSIFVMNPDGSGQTRITDTLDGIADDNPAWSPDGTKIALMSERAGGFPALFTMNPDGSALTQISGEAEYPDWSPDSAQLAFERRDGRWSSNVYVVGRDGGVGDVVTNEFVGPTEGINPSWSPHGDRIAYVAPRPTGNPQLQPIGFTEIIVVNADGSGVTDITNTDSAREKDPAWQPDVIAGVTYARPRGATPVRVSLVPAYTACGTPNRTHGAPLEVGSCAPPVQASSYLTVGTLDANGKPANSVGHERIDVVNGNPATPADEADLRFMVEIEDVRMAGTLDDYEGRLLAVNTVRITDRASNGPVAATTVDTPFNVPVDCTRIPTAQIGATCSVSTTADSLVPGSIKEGGRSNWGLSQVEVFDGGADSDVTTAADNTLFEVQGIFVP
jgi:dipeptidyl aminopeptidase/acylaminoacyl peptidase